MKKINVAIDGYSACGKSTTAKALARELNYTYIDSGAMYRATTLYFLDNNVTITNPLDVKRALTNIVITFNVKQETGENQIFLNGRQVEKEIREMRITQFVSEVSAISEVRRALVRQQQKLARNKGVVMDGRDIGTVVIPDADLKIFMTADPDVRAERRQKELFEKDLIYNLEEVKANLSKRDRIDSTREDSPLRQAEDAVLMDTTHVTVDEQIETVRQMALGKIFEDKELQIDNR